MQNHLRKPISIICLALTLSLNLAYSAGAVGKNVKTSPARAAGVRAATASLQSRIDAGTMTLMNSGDWAAVAAHIEKLLAGKLPEKLSPAARLKRSYLQAWLSFAYMYVGKPAKTKELLTQIEAEKAKAETQVLKSDVARQSDCFTVVKAMDEVAQGHFDEAGKLLQAGSADAASDCLYNFALACVAGKKGQAQVACDYSRKAFEADRRFAWGLRTIAFLEQKWLKDNRAAEAVLIETLAVEPRISEARDMLVDVKLSRNDFDGAVAAAQTGIKLSPKSAAAHFRLSQIYTQQWRLKESLKELDRAITLDGSSAKYFRNRATVKKLAEDLPGALSDQTKAVELSKDKGFELAELANLNLLAGNTNKAIDCLKEALTSDPENAAARERLYKLLVTEKRYSDLASEYKEQLTRHPKNAALHLGYANVLLALNEDEKAIEEFKEAANLNQTDPSPHRSLGAYYIQKRKFSQAAKEYTRALNIVPTSIKDMVSLGFCYAENDDYMQAEAAFVTAMALQQLTPGLSPDEPSRIDVMRSLACLLYDEGRYGDAATQFENLVVGFKDKGATADDAFLLAKCKLLRDQTETTAKGMMAVFEVLPPERKEGFRYGMVEALLDAGMPALARQNLDKIPVEARTGNLLYALYDAVALRLEGKFKEAQEALAAANASMESARSENANLVSRLLVERCRVEIALDEPVKAKASAQDALNLYEKSYPAYLCLAELAIKASDHKLAVEMARKALQLNPYYAPAYLLIGQSQSASADAAVRKEGLENLKKAIELYPGWLAGHRALLRAYENSSMIEEAKKEAAQIVVLEAGSKER
ncbi:MAG TPA: tetratricopeptide repeat protein [Candidatus Obscuribacter sp.]|nr:tetratricopeptide repeat protein [Candidatus Obscuribacter sp.]HNB13789.1 tetratricopeptide repeat protein [Candidatus Obscuribacter sp.]HND65202.1 tetratricopeptide repeat protein [Candidatus Obscuribacter sp.]HNG18891.1 tetratricopeptide repeat protein [Candidatus Obscuribacter sp.]HNH74084.1 tetratricopeptide repeat protein [Candidatus Obscuribacter sp.]